MVDYSGYIQSIEKTRAERVKERETYRVHQKRVIAPFKAFLMALHEAGVISQPKEETVGLDDCDLVFYPQETQIEMRLRVRDVTVKEGWDGPHFTWTATVAAASRSSATSFDTLMPESITAKHQEVYTLVAETVGRALANAHNME